ncbi:MAG: rod shape-determining protein MreD [Chloroflexota bacterium]
MGRLILPVETLIEGLSRRYGGSKVSRETTLPRLGRASTLGILARPPVWSPSRRRAGRGTQISYATLLLAILIGILHAAVAPVLVIGDVHPNLILVAVVLVTVLNGFGPGVAWAFVGGLTANLLIREPLGSLPLALLLVAAAVAGGERLLGRLSWGYPLASVAVGSLIVDTISVGILQMVDLPLSGGFPMQRIIAASLLNTAIAAIVLPPTRILLARAGSAETGAW